MKSKDLNPGDRVMFRPTRGIPGICAGIVQEVIAPGRAPDRERFPVLIVADPETTASGGGYVVSRDATNTLHWVGNDAVWPDGEILKGEELRNAIIMAHQMATGTYLQSDSEMRARIGALLEKVVMSDAVMRGFLGYVDTQRSNDAICGSGSLQEETPDTPS